MIECDKLVSYPTNDRKWPWFVAWSLIVYAIGLVLILLGRLGLCLFVTNGKRNSSIDAEQEDESEELEESWYLDFKESAGNLVSGQSRQGRVLVVVSFMFNLCACAIYISESSYPEEYCLIHGDTVWKIEMAMNVFFTFHFIIRFLAANDKLYFWIADPLTLIDILTIPTVFVAVYLERNWLGLRFLRIIYMVNFAEILQFLNVLHAGPTVEMVHMFGTFIAVWLSSAGVVHLLENTGDFWAPITYENNHTINFFESTYFLLVTMSTVGYGDIYCKTFLGRFFCMCFIGVGLGLFASYLPAIQEYFTSHTKFHLDFKHTPGKRHVIVAGYITAESVLSFLKDFLHIDRDDSSTMVIFLAPVLPSTSMQAILKRYETRALYFIGTIYSTVDCERLKMREANAAIILCNKKAPIPDDEDAANISRVISVKNFHEDLRCIVQLIQNKNKPHLLNCPQWNRKLGDDIICINELKLGFIAQSCNAPGFSTLISNLFSMRRDTVESEISEAEQWKVGYMIGASNEVYAAPFSTTFTGMTFIQAVELLINPNDKKVKLSKSAKGFFLAQNQNDAMRVFKYCGTCHKDLVDPDHMGKCKCRGNRGGYTQFKPSELADKNSDLHLLEGITDDHKAMARKLTEDYYPNGDKPKFDQTGTFYWCVSRSFALSKLTLQEAASEQFVNHVVVLVLSSNYSPPTELRQLVLPLRASNNALSSLKKVVILGDGDYLYREWKSLENFPDVDVVPGSPYNRSDLRAVNVNTASMVILLSPGHNSDKVEHQALSDKEVILVTLNLKAMKFDRSKLFIKNEPNKALRDSLRDSFVDVSSNIGSRVSSRVSHRSLKYSAITTTRSQDPLQETKKQETARSQSVMTTSSVLIENKKKEDFQTAPIPIITELLYDNNAMYLDQDDMNIYDDDGIFLTQPYACGSAFTVSVLDSLVSATYFNGDVLTIVRNLVTGSVSSDLDEILAEGKQPTGSYETAEIAAVRHRCRVGQLSLSDGLLSDFGECGLFGDLFLYALRTYSMICLGLYRFRDTERAALKSSKRYVITFPPFNFVLSPTDKVFVLMQFDSRKRKARSVVKKPFIVLK